MWSLQNNYWGHIMNKYRFITNISFMILGAIFLSTKSFAEPINLHELKKSFRTYHDSGMYVNEIEKVTLAADKYITETAANNAKSPNPKKLGIVLDIDETSISNYEHIAKSNFCSNWSSYLLKANSPAIKPVLSLYKNALKNNVSIFFITGRRTRIRDVTIKNLKAAGYKKWAGLYTRPLQYKQKSIQNFKSQTRAMLQKQGYTIIASIGDQQSDLDGGYAQKTFKLPNPYYYIS